MSPEEGGTRGPASIRNAAGIDSSSATLDRLHNRATKVTLMGIFLGLIAIFSTQALRRTESFEMKPFDLLLLGLSSFRTGRIIAYERVGSPLREPFTSTQRDESGAGETVVAAGTGGRRAIGELLSCPICAGTWVAAGLVYGLHLAPRATRVFLAIMSATGVAEIVYSFTEALSWFARAARKKAA